MMPELLELSLDDPELQAPGRPSRRGAGGGGRSPQFCEIEFQELDQVLTINMGEKFLCDSAEGGENDLIF